MKSPATSETIEASAGLSQSDNIKVAVRVRPISATSPEEQAECIKVAQVHRHFYFLLALLSYTLAKPLSQCPLLMLCMHRA
jgi:hypothetical protein